MSKKPHSTPSPLQLKIIFFLLALLCIVATIAIGTSLLLYQEGTLAPATQTEMQQAARVQISAHPEERIALFSIANVFNQPYADHNDPWKLYPAMMALSPAGAFITTETPDIGAEPVASTYLVTPLKVDGRSHYNYAALCFVFSENVIPSTKCYLAKRTTGHGNWFMRETGSAALIK